MKTSNHEPKKKNDHRFTAKWSLAIAEHGFVEIPNLIFFHRKQLGISVPEFFIIISIETYRWDDKDPYPSLEALRKRTGFTARTISRHISNLQTKGLIIRTRRKGTSNVYTLKPLINKLDQIAISGRGPGREVPPGLDKTAAYRASELSGKEYQSNNTQLKKPLMNNSDAKSFRDLVKQKYGSPP